MWNRQTGLECGPRVPIRPDEWPYKTISPMERVWRYMQLEKFEKLLEQNAFYFARGDQFKCDPWEGRFAAGQTSFSQTDMDFMKAYGINPSFEDARSAHETHRKCIFVSCWHRNKRENPVMWSRFPAESVSVMTTARTLFQLVPEHIMKHPVKYHEDGFLRPYLFGWNSLALHKPNKFSFEQEFRMILPLKQNDSVSHNDADKDFGRLVPVRLTKVVRRVITHPLASVACKQRVDELLRTKLRSTRRENSHIPVDEYVKALTEIAKMNLPEP
jgi:hypothetical protein